MMKCSYGAKAKLLVNAVFLGKRSKEYNAYSMLEGGFPGLCDVRPLSYYTFKVKRLGV